MCPLSPTSRKKRKSQFDEQGKIASGEKKATEEEKGVEDEEMAEEIVPAPPKPRVKMSAKKTKLDQSTLEKTTKFYPFIFGAAKACFSDLISKKKVIKERGLN